MQLRLLTRRLRSYKQRQTQIENEIHNLLQRANIKLISYLSDIFSKTGLSLFMLFINGEVIDYDNVTAYIHKHVKASPEELMETMNGKLSLEDRFLLDQNLEEYQLYKKLMNKLTSEIMLISKRSFPEENRLLQTIPGVSETCAATILAEIGPTVTAFPSDAHLASWAGLCPRSYESADIKKSSHITQGNRYIKQALTMSGLIVAHSKDPAFSSFYNRISQRGSKMKAVITCEHQLLRIITKFSQHTKNTTNKKF